MKDQLHMHDIVALLEDTPAVHSLTGQPLILRRGQIGTVVMLYDGTVFEVEFSGRAMGVLTRFCQLKPTS